MESRWRLRLLGRVSLAYLGSWLAIVAVAACADVSGTTPSEGPLAAFHASPEAHFPEQSLWQKVTAQPAEDGEAFRPNREASPLTVHRSELLVLSSPYSDFGGWSGLTESADGTFTSISDTASWMQWRPDPVQDPLGQPPRILSGQRGPLHGEDGRSIQSRGGLDSDSEEIVALPNGGFLVSFERRHRLAYYRTLSSSAVPVDFPVPMEQMPDTNRGIEALTLLPDGRLLAIAEGISLDRVLRGWIGTPTGSWTETTAPSVRWEGFTLANPPGVNPTAVTINRCGMVVILKRGMSKVWAFQAVLDVLPLSQIEDQIRRRQQGEDVSPVPSQPLLFFRRYPFGENWEGMALSREDGDTLWLISDDNFMPIQRTLLLPVHGLASVCPAGGK